MDTILVSQHNDEYYIYFFANNQKQLYYIYNNKDVALQKAKDLCKIHNFNLLTSLDTTQQKPITATEKSCTKKTDLTKGKRLGD